LTGWSLGEARKTLGVGVSVVVGSSKLSGVVTGVSVVVEMLEVGVPGIGGVRGVSVARGAGKLQADSPKKIATTVTHQRSGPVDKRFLMHSSFSGENRNRWLDLSQESRRFVHFIFLIRL